MAHVNLGKVHIQKVPDFWVSMDASFMFSHVHEASNPHSNEACWSYTLHYQRKLFVWRDSLFFSSSEQRLKVAEKAR
jgi:hypothetical protein